MKQEFFPISVWYTGGRTRATMVRPPESDARASWRRDVEAIARCGFNSVRAWVDWSSGEPAPGQYRFETLDLLMELAEENGLRVILQVYLDSAPDWLVRLYPDCRYVSATGIPIDSQGAPGYCFDHPGVHERAEEFLTRLASHVAQSQALYAWDLWSEPHIVQWGYFDHLPKPGMYCYCPHTIRRFQDWLKRRYGELDSLNRAWYRAFGGWEEILPPKFVSLMSHTEFVDWQEFILDKLAEDLRWRHELVRRCDGHLTSSHSSMPAVFTLPISSHGSPDDWRMCRQVDIWGTSLYPKHLGAAETNHPAFRAAMLDTARSACDAVDSPMWLGELQAGHGYVGVFAAQMTAEDARFYGWQSVAHGVKGLHWYAWYPMTSGLESAGFGMAGLDGLPSPRAIAAGEVARLVSRHSELFLPARPAQARAAVCYDVYSNIMWVCMRQYEHYIPSRCYIGVYYALHAEKLPVDFVHVEQIGAGQLDPYRILFLPFAFMLPEAAAEGLKAFVRRGGVLWAEARTAWNNENGQCGQAVPGFGLDEVFGCRESGVAGVAEPETVRIRIVREHPALPLLREGDELLGSLYRQELEVSADDAVVVGVFENGKPALVVHPHGEGAALLTGTLLSYAYYQHRDQASGDAYRGLGRFCGLRPPLELEVQAGVEPSLVDARLLEGGRYRGQPARVAFLFNYTGQPAGVTLRLPREVRQVVDLASEKPFGLREGRLSRRLEPNEVWVAVLLDEPAAGLDSGRRPG